MALIFISHIEENEPQVREIVKALEDEGYDTWYYEEHNLPGHSYLLQTSEAIKRCDAFLLLISHHSITSSEMRVEVIRAHQCGKPFIPVLMDITHTEFQTKQPEWSEAIGAAASVRVPAEGIHTITPRIIKGLKAMGIEGSAKEPDGHAHDAPAPVNPVREEKPAPAPANKPVKPAPAKVVKPAPAPAPVEKVSPPARAETQKYSPPAKPAGLKDKLLNSDIFSRKSMWYGLAGLLALILVLVLILGFAGPKWFGGGGDESAGGASTPDEAIDTFVEAMEQKDIPLLVSTFSPSSLERLEGEMGDYFDDLDQLFEKVLFSTYSSVEFDGVKYSTVIDGNTATLLLTDGTMTITNSNGEKASGSAKDFDKLAGLELVKENGKWYIDPISI